jgi:hypothetical protein
MKVEVLVPAPTDRRPFRHAHRKFVPNRPGCYVLSTFAGVVLYVGLAENLRRRMGEHLDTPEKISGTRIGRAVWFHWIESEETNKVERTWMNIHNLAEGCLPTLNKVYSPTRT